MFMNYKFPVGMDCTIPYIPTTTWLAWYRGSRVPFYLFRDRGVPNTFAYSADVTGRNLPREAPCAPCTEWIFVAMITSHRDIPKSALGHLRRNGFCVLDMTVPNRASRR
jgi:hypothetical protein